MPNKFDEMRQAVSEARQTLSAADDVANAMAILLEGRLRKVNDWNLKKLKAELRDFNAHTGKWRTP